MDAVVKQEIIDQRELPEKKRVPEVPKPISVIELSSSDSDSECSDDSDDDSAIEPFGKRQRGLNGVDGGSSKKRKLDVRRVVLPLGFLDPLPPEEPLPLPEPIPQPQSTVVVKGSKQFWKSGDYEGGPAVDSASYSGAGNQIVTSKNHFEIYISVVTSVVTLLFSAKLAKETDLSLSSISAGGMDHVRVHPKFLHSNATSHKWALGAFAELMDNSLDEVCHGATYINIDMLKNTKDGSRMLLVEDNGGGMDPDKMRHCMSLGYSAKSKLANTIGQYGNGFKTSTMRLGADVIVFSRCRGKDGKSPTQSIGMLSYTFLRSTGKEDIVVPMLDYGKGGRDWNKMARSSSGDWSRNVETIVQWSPYSSESNLLQQFNTMKDQGTRIVIYNLWEDDQGELELDFDSDRHDIQIRGVNRDEKKIEMAKQFPNSRHFLTYRHSLRSYASILYLRLPPGFRIVLRGKDVEHHNIVNDMMLSQEVTYKPQPGADGVQKDLNMVAVVTIGFVKDAKNHIDVQGFNVYHKNRLIKPFWRVWNAAGSDGRGVIGVLEANFVEPAHDKQGFERTTVLSRLEARLVVMQKTYWSTKCHLIGYAPRRQKKLINESIARETSPEYLPQPSARHSKKCTSPSNKTPLPTTDKYYSCSGQKQGRRELERSSKMREPEKSSKTREPERSSKMKEAERSSKMMDHKHGNGDMYSKGEKGMKTTTNFGKTSNSLEPTAPSAKDVSDDQIHIVPPVNGNRNKTFPARKYIQKDDSRTAQSSPNSENIEIQREHVSNGITDRIATRSQSKVADANGNGHAPSNSDTHSLEQLKEENRKLRERLQKKEELVLGDLLRDLQFERDRCKSLEIQLQEVKRKIEETNIEQEALIDIFSEERNRRDNEEENLRKKLKEASNTIQELLDKVRLQEKMKTPNYKPEHQVR
ncbi:hypothetical protein HHK36_015886 [Tetracentron sinense]|uniref:Morc S5 domain-containing protein n=1 Tax=Tetracentron sinense TaxID=13715 RepID=A0A834Z7Z5_TETSI|nr:hypothetical protein HHK36_015886 [Tetracentron sinense]